jgi:hypothetical protein
MSKWTWWTKEDTDEITKEIIYHEEDVAVNFLNEMEKDNDEIIGVQLYNTDGTVKDHLENQRFVHKILKNGFISALMNKFMKKYRDKLMKTVPEGYQFEDLKIFKEAYDDAVKDWCYKYQFIEKDEKDIAKAVSNPAYPNLILPKPKSKEEADKHYLDVVNGRLGFMGEAYLTICANDSAYMEFNSILLRCLQKRLKTLNPEHLLYIDSNINDPKYFIPVANWSPEVAMLARQLMGNNIRFVELVTNPDGSTGFKIDFNKIPNFVKNMPENGN